MIVIARKVNVSADDLVGLVNDLLIGIRILLDGVWEWVNERDCGKWTGQNDDDGEWASDCVKILTGKSILPPWMELDNCNGDVHYVDEKRSVAVLIRCWHVAE